VRTRVRKESCCSTNRTQLASLNAGGGEASGAARRARGVRVRIRRGAGVAAAVRRGGGCARARARWRRPRATLRTVEGRGPRAGARGAPVAGAAGAARGQGAAGACQARRRAAGAGGAGSVKAVPRAARAWTRAKRACRPSRPRTRVSRTPGARATARARTRTWTLHTRVPAAATMARARHARIPARAPIRTTTGAMARKTPAAGPGSRRRRQVSAAAALRTPPRGGAGRPPAAARPRARLRALRSAGNVPCAHTCTCMLTRDRRVWRSRNGSGGAVAAALLQGAARLPGSTAACARSGPPSLSRPCLCFVQRKLIQTCENPPDGMCARGRHIHRRHARPSARAQVL